MSAQTTSALDPTVAAVPDEWESHDIGSVGAAGSSELVGTRVIVRGSGADVWGTADAFHFTWQVVSGDFEVETLGVPERSKPRLRSLEW